MLYIKGHYRVYSVAGEMKTTCNVRIKISGEVVPEMIINKFLNTSYRNGEVNYWKRVPKANNSVKVIVSR